MASIDMVKFGATTFTMQIAINKKATKMPVRVVLSDGEVPLTIVQAACCGGSSPRVNFQSKVRRNGYPIRAQDGVYEVKMSPAEWFGNPVHQQNVVVVREMTVEELIQRMKTDDNFRKQLLDGQDKMYEENKENETDTDTSEESEEEKDE